MTIQDSVIPGTNTNALRILSIEATENGSGSELIKAAILESQARGMGGAIWAEPLSEAVDWYRKKGFSETIDGDMFFSAKDAQSWLQNN